MSETSALTEAVFYILLSLNQPRHGYGIMQETERMSGGRVHLAAGTLYGALNTLSGKGWIEGASGSADSRQKKYCITPAGQAVLRQELVRLEELVRNGRAVLGTIEDKEGEEK